MTAPKTPTATSPREHLAWLMYCYQQGYTDPRDRAIGDGNWIARDDPATFTPDDAKLRLELLGMADEVLALAIRNRRLFSTEYRAMINGDVWCESTDPEEVSISPAGATLVKRETYLADDGWVPWDGKAPGDQPG